MGHTLPMTLLKRARDTAHDLENVDLNALRAKIVDAVEVAIDGSERLRSRAGDAIDDAPSAAEMAKRARNSRAWELAGTAAAAAGPLAASALRHRSTRRGALHAARVAPKVVFRTHPLMIGFAAIGGAAAGIALVRRLRAKAELERVDELATKDGLDDQHARMDGEGPEPGRAASTPGGSAAETTRRFVRAKASSEDAHYQL